MAEQSDAEGAWAGMVDQATSSLSPALRYTQTARCSTSMARVGRLWLPHNELETPIFMPVGTAAAVKGMTVDELEALDVPLILGNTCVPRPAPLARRPRPGWGAGEAEARRGGGRYHLALRPGTDLLAEMGGLHDFMGWKRAMLTDSGGFQMVSLLKLANITEEGVTFQSPSDGTQMLLTPEKSIQLQNEIGADIMMALDDVVPPRHTTIRPASLRRGRGRDDGHLRLFVIKRIFFSRGRGGR